MAEVEGEAENEDESAVGAGKYGVVAVEPVAVDAHFARIIWSDGRVGRIKISEDGNIQRAVVIGMVDGQEQRRANDERVLVDEGARIDTLVNRLEQIYESR